MSELPITRSDYDKATLMIDFLSVFKQRISEKNGIEDVNFAPQVKGYIVSFIYNNVPFKIVLSMKNSSITTKLKIEYIVENEKIKGFISKNNHTNQEIINEILA